MQTTDEIKQWQCRIAPSLGGGFAGTPNKCWGTRDYLHETEPTVFFGLYGLPDFYMLWRHKGEKAILWAGSDITHFINGYWLDENGSMRVEPHALAKWIDAKCDNWVENDAEMEALKKVGIHAKVCPSFLGNINDYKVGYKQSDKPKVYTSVSGDNFKLYGWDEVEKLAKKHSEITFYLYGNTKKWETKNNNVIVRGRVPQEVMNAEIKEMQGGLRMLSFEGFSEVIAKSLLWGQWPISKISYPHTLSLGELGTLKDKKDPNVAGRDYYRRVFNSFPWNKNK